MNNCCQGQEQIHSNSFNKIELKKIVKFICEKKVIPIIGEELLQVESNLMFDVCSKWIEILEIELDISRLEPISLEKVAFEILKKNIRLEADDLANTLDEVFENYTFSSPDLIQLLTKIEDFKLYITTTVDPFLEYSIKKIRYNDDMEKNNNSIIVNKLNELKDLNLNNELNKIENPLLYYLFGKVNFNPDFVISEEDRLEFMHKIFKSNDLSKLLYELSNNNILIIGSLYSNWLARFFIRFLRNDRLSDSSRLGRNTTWIVGQSMSTDEQLCQFCTSPLCNNYKIIKTNNISVFINKLYEEWEKRAFKEKGAVKNFSLENDQIDSNKPFVFLSYCREDEKIAKKIHNQLNKNGIQVWFDNKDLPPGAKFKNEIIDKINHCTLFCVLISENTERLRNKRRFFMRESYEASEIIKSMNEDMPFIVPIVTSKNIDLQRIPDAFKSANYIYLDDSNDISSDDISYFIKQFQKCQL